MKIVLTHDADSALRKQVPAPRAKRIRDKIADLAANPSAPHLDVKPLKGRGEYRLRVGSYRVIYSIEGDTITILKVGPRGDVYK